MSETQRKELRKIVEPSEFYRSISVDHFEIIIGDDGKAKIMLYTDHPISKMGFTKTEPDALIRRLEVQLNMSLPMLIRLGNKLTMMAKEAHNQFFKTWEQSKKELG